MYFWSDVSAMKAYEQKISLTFYSKPSTKKAPLLKFQAAKRYVSLYGDYPCVLFCSSLALELLSRISSSPVGTAAASPIVTITIEEIENAIDDINRVSEQILFGQDIKAKIVQKISHLGLIKGKNGLVVGGGKEDYLAILFAKLGLIVSVIDIDEGVRESQRRLYSQFKLQDEIVIYTTYKEIGDKIFDYIFLFAVLNEAVGTLLEHVETQTALKLLMSFNVPIHISEGITDRLDSLLKINIGEIIKPILEHLDLSDGYIFINVPFSRNFGLLPNEQKELTLLDEVLKEIADERKANFKLQPDMDISDLSMNTGHLFEKRAGSVYRAERFVSSLMNYRILKHQTSAIVQRIEYLSNEICPKEAEELIEIFTVFTNIVYRLHSDIPIDSITDFYKGEKLNVQQVVDIVYEKASVLSDRIQEVIREDRLDGKGDVSYIYAAVWTMCGLIDKYVRGKSQDISLHNLNALLVEFKQRQAMYKLNVEIEGDRNIYVKVSVLEFFEVFTELADNAVEHGNAQNVYITVDRKDNTIEITFRDDGDGMSKEALLEDESGIPAVFKDFNSRIEEGGLGLKIIYNIVTRKWGANIFVESKQQKGTTFTISLPIEESVASPIDSLPPTVTIAEFMAETSPQRKVELWKTLILSNKLIFDAMDQLRKQSDLMSTTTQYIFEKGGRDVISVSFILNEVWHFPEFKTYHIGQTHLSQNRDITVEDFLKLQLTDSKTKEKLTMQQLLEKEGLMKDFRNILPLERRGSFYYNEQTSDIHFYNETDESVNELTMSFDKNGKAIRITTSLLAGIDIPPIHIIDAGKKLGFVHLHADGRIVLSGTDVQYFAEAREQIFAIATPNGHVKLWYMDNWENYNKLINSRGWDFLKNENLPDGVAKKIFAYTECNLAESPFAGSSPVSTMQMAKYHLFLKVKDTVAGDRYYVSIADSVIDTLRPSIDKKKYSWDSLIKLLIDRQKPIIFRIKSDRQLRRYLREPSSLGDRSKEGYSPFFEDFLEEYPQFIISSSPVKVVPTVAVITAGLVCSIIWTKHWPVILFLTAVGTIFILKNWHKFTKKPWKKRWPKPKSPKGKMIIRVRKGKRDK